MRRGEALGEGAEGFAGHAAAPHVGVRACSARRPEQQHAPEGKEETIVRARGRPGARGQLHLLRSPAELGALAAILATAATLYGRDWPSSRGRPDFGPLDMDVDLRRIVTSAGVINTTSAPGLQACTTRGEAAQAGSGLWESERTRRRWGRQWYVQTRGLLTAQQRGELEADAGLKLGPYFPHSAYLIVATRDQACRTAKARHVLWVGERERAQKIDSTVLALNFSNTSLAQGRGGGGSGGFPKGIEDMPIALNVGLWQHTRRHSASVTSEVLAMQIAERILTEFAINASVRAPALDKVVVETSFAEAHRIADWLAQDAYVVQVELKATFASRNDNANRILVSGSSAKSLAALRAQEPTPFASAGLDGSGVTVGLADTGLDYDHCMLWQRPADWFCFEPDMIEMQDFKKCPYSAIAGLLENQDFEEFLDMMIRTPVDVPLMSSGRTKGSSTKLAPMDIEMPDRAARQKNGFIFSLANDTSLPVLLKAWRKVRQPLLSILSREETCTGCGGKVLSTGGVTVFEQKSSDKYFFSKTDKSWDVVNRTLGNNWSTFEKILTEKCICYWIRPGPATVNPLEAWMGPMPNIKQLQLMKSTPTASIVRKGAGLPALPTELLEGLCNATKGGGNFPVPSFVRDADGIRQDICDVNVTYQFDDPTEKDVMYPCNLKWEPRAVEEAIARCVMAEYLKKPKPTEDAYKDNSRMYTWNTTLEWWKEYTTIPPFDHVDFSRRKVNSYYTYEGCEACGMCSRLRLDSRNYENIEVSKQMPATLSKDELLSMHVKTVDSDWRLDAFEGKNVGFRVDLQMSLVRIGVMKISVDIGKEVGFCVLTNDDYLEASNLRSRQFWAQNCINVGGRVFGSGESVNASVLKPFRASRVMESGETRYLRSETIPELPRSADGWRVVVWNDVSSKTLADFYLRMYTLPVDCSDKKDGRTGITENTHSINLEKNQHLQSLKGKDQCVKDGRTYCDNTHHSGRQLDLCLVCGGTCFEPGCTKADCYGQEGNENMIRIRFLGEFPQSVVSKVFELPQRSNPGIPCPPGQGGSKVDPEVYKCDLYSSGPGMVCPSPTDPAIRCMAVADTCDYQFACRKRIETYDIDTRMLHVKAGVPHTFETGRLLFESGQKGRMVRMRILALTDPTWHLRTRTMLDGIQGGGEVKLSSKFPRFQIAGGREWSSTLGDWVEQMKNILVYKGLNLTESQVEEKTTEIVVTIHETHIAGFLEGLTYTPDAASGTSMDNRQRLLRIQLQILKPDRTPFPPRNQGVGGYEDGFDKDGGCKPGFAGKACDTIFPPFDLRFTVEPRDKGQRLVYPGADAEGKGGRKRILSRDGHGTHVATGILGRSLSSRVGAIADTTKFDGLAGGAQLAFIDIAKSGNVYLTPPESLGDMLLKKAYTEAKARIFLNPWTCEDYVWWKDQDLPFQLEQAVASSFPLNQMANICNRYTTDAWEIDDFVARHPDLLVVFPAGDNGVGGLSSVSSPGTCKNCLTVGTSQSWSQSLADSVDFLLSQCRAEDCPQDFDKTETCADPKRASPYATPACCRTKYTDAAYGAGTIDPRSSRGFAVNQQAPFDIFGGNTYKDMKALKFDRIKPDIVAPGVNIVSGRSDGDAGSGGMDGSRCGLQNDGQIKDTGCLVAMSGSSMAAAKATAVAALVRQFFADGFYPGGVKGFSPAFDPSAALVKAVILAAGDEMQKAVALNASVEDIENLPVPNLFYGFGRPRLMNVLKVQALMNSDGTNAEEEARAQQNTMGAGTKKVDNTKVCNCTRNNSLMFAPSVFSAENLRNPAALLAAQKTDANGARFGIDYGLSCAPWNAMRDGRRQQCDTIFAKNPTARQTPPGQLVNAMIDETCCVSWCFVDARCPLAQKWEEIPGLYYSTETCVQEEKYQEKCPFRDTSMTRDIKTTAFDHSIMAVGKYTIVTNGSSDTVSCNVWKNPEPLQCDYYKFATDLNPVRGAISQNESFIYTFRILGASPAHPLVVSMVFTDPVGALGASTVMVNDLDLSVLYSPLKVKIDDGTELGWTGEAENRTFSTASLNFDSNRTGTLFFGNNIAGGDPGNNAEVVRLKIAEPAEIQAIVYGRRIADSLPGSEGPCQPFALVITGQLDLDVAAQPISLSTVPKQLELGICGRRPKQPPPKQKGLALWQIILIALGAMVGMLLIIFISYKFIYRRALNNFDRKRVNRSQPGLIGYLSKLEKVLEEEGIAQGGAYDHIILSEQASAVDGFYEGLPIIILGGPGEGESGVITEYLGRTRRATVDFENDVGYGSKYAIRHDKGLGTGYKIGAVGYMPVGHLPQPDEHQSEIYSKQFKALGMARAGSGNLNSHELERIGIGRADRVLTKREQVQQLKAGVYVGSEIGSGDLFKSAVTKPGQEEWDDGGGGVGAKKEPKNLVEYAENYHEEILRSEAGKGFQNPTGLKGRNAEVIAKGSQIRAPPPLKTHSTSGTGFVVPGWAASKRNRATLSKAAENLKDARTWETDSFNFDAAFGNPPTEPDPISSVVTATLSTSKANGVGNGEVYEEHSDIEDLQKRLTEDSPGPTSPNGLGRSVSKGSKGNGVAHGGRIGGTAAAKTNPKDRKKLLSTAFD